MVDSAKKEQHVVSQCLVFLLASFFHPCTFEQKQNRDKTTCTLACIFLAISVVFVNLFVGNQKVFEYFCLYQNRIKHKAGCPSGKHGEHRPWRMCSAYVEIPLTSALCLLHGQSVTLHTSLGDVKIEVSCDTAPRTAEVRPAIRSNSDLSHYLLETSFQNFLALCACGAYDGTKFHR